VPGLRVDHQYLPIQFEQGIQGRIGLHEPSLSHTDKEVANRAEILTDRVKGISARFA
jgi:hypothetical protein